MADAANTSDPHVALLDELVELGMSLARDVQAAALAAETVEEKASLAAAFHRVARTVRQSLALRQRLLNEARRLAAERAREAVAVHKAQVRARVREMVWNEAEPSDCAALVEELDDRLSDVEHLEGQASETVEGAIARLRRELGLEAGVLAARRRKAPQGPARPHEIKVTFVDPTPGRQLSAVHGRFRDDPDTG